MKEIPLTRGYVAQVDDADHDDLMHFKWHALVVPLKHKTKVYAARNDGTEKVYMHRYLMGNPAGQDVDHQDDNGLNNQRSNLRVASRSQNNFNSLARKQSRSTSYMGVCFLHPDKYPKYADKPYKAYVQDANKRKIHLGYFATAEQAARARDKAAIAHYGEFAALNFPDNLS